MAPASEVIDKEALSPELCIIQKTSDHTYCGKENQINLIPEGVHTSDQSQSLLQVWINSPSLTENISGPVFSTNAVVEGQQSNPVDIKLNGLQEDSKEKISQKLSNEDLFSEINLGLNVLLEDTLMIPKEQTPQDAFPHVLEDCQRACMTNIDMGNGVKQCSPNYDTDCSLTSQGKVFMESFSESKMETDELEISDLLRVLGDPTNVEMVNPSPDELECQNQALTIDPSLDETNDALSVQSVKALSGPVVQPVSPIVRNEGQLNTEVEQLNSECSIPQLDDDCTQITNGIEPELPTVRVEEIKALRGSNFQRTTTVQPMGDEQGEKELILDYGGATSSETQTEEEHSHSVEAAAWAGTAQTMIELRGTARSCSDRVSSHCQVLEETQQRMSSSDKRTGNKAKDFDKIQKSTSKDKQNLETSIYQEMLWNECTKGEPRRSKRIENQMRQKAFRSTQICTISRPTVNRRNAYGETVLHRAVFCRDVDLIHKIIKAGGNVNSQDNAGWTPLHEASVRGFCEIAKELLKAGARVDARGHEQMTPLQVAVKEGYYEMAELLLQYGADPLLINGIGRCALEETSEPFMRTLLKNYVAKSRRYSVSDGNDSTNMLNTQSIEDTNLHKTNDSKPAYSNPMDSDSTDMLQETIVNDMQNIYTNISEDGTSCTEQTLQANAETVLACELSAASNGESISKSPSNSTIGVLSTTEQKAPQPERGGRVLLNAEESIEECHIETENASSLERKLMVLELHEKDRFQTTRKRKDLQETSAKAYLHFGVNADSRSPESLQRTDDGVFAGISGTEGTENNGEEGNAETNTLSQFTKTAVRTKRVRLPLEASQKAASCRSSSKGNLLSNQSQCSQASKWQMSKKSGPGRKKKTKIKATGETLLHLAARRGDLCLVKTLVSSGISVNKPDYAGWTPIHEASNGGFTEVILELLKAGADVNCRGLGGILPIHDAVYGNYWEAANILLQHGANPCEKDDTGQSALDKAYDDDMKELLKCYSAVEPVCPVETIEVRERRYPSRSRISKKSCDSYENNSTGLEKQHEKYSAEAVAAIQNAEEKQKELLLLDLRTSEDADVYIQKLSEIQDTLNKMLAKQKTERDTLAKKYRASVESFRKGALRNQIVNLASKQKGLLTVAQTQEQLVQKIQNYRKTKQVFSASCSEKQVSNLVISPGNDRRHVLTADGAMCLDVFTFSTGLGASMPNGNQVEAHLSLQNRFLAQECSQRPHICLDETRANKEAIRSKEASDHALASEKRLREYPFDNMSELTNAVEVVTLPSELTVSTAKTKCLQQKDIDCVAIAEQGDKSLNPTSVTSTSNTVRPQSTVVNYSVCQPGSDCQQVLTDEDLHRCVNKKALQQQEQRILLTATENFHNAVQQMTYQISEKSFNANSMLTNVSSNTDYTPNISKKSSQSYNPKTEQCQVRYRRQNKKKLQLIDLLELERIKPGENVLEFKLQEFSHKATLLNNGKIKTSKQEVLQDPVQWVKDILGDDIHVTWKYVWSKVTYLGTQLSKFIDGEVSVSSDLELSSQEREILGSNFVMRDPSNHNQHHQSPGTVSIAQPLGNFNLSNMHPKSPSLPQTEALKTLLYAEREVAGTREFRNKICFKLPEKTSWWMQGLYNRYKRKKKLIVWN